MEDLISVIVPIYEVEEYVGACIDSICRQTFPHLEIILVDDGSPDNCGAICDEYAARDFRVKVIHKENGGLSDARNTGLDAAKGQYIAFVDGDDTIKPDMYELLLGRMKETCADMALCPVLTVDIRGETIAGKQFSAPDGDLELTRDEAFLQLLSKNSVTFSIVTNRLYREGLFHELRFPVGRIHEDEFVMHHIYWQCSRVAFLHKPLYCYTQRPSSIMNREFFLQRLDGVEGMLDRAGFAWDKGMFELASCSCRQAMNILGEGYQCLDRRDPAVRQRIRELRHRILAFYPKIMASSSSLWGKLVFTLFVPHTRCYLAAKALYPKRGIGRKPVVTNETTPRGEIHL